METSPKNHIGRKISRIRERRGVKQEMLAEAMGVSQQTISWIENSEEVDEKRLKQIAQALGVSKEAIENFSEENVIAYFNTFNDNSGAGPCSINPTFNFNPVDKIVELYERLVEAEKEKVTYLEQLVKE